MKGKPNRTKAIRAVPVDGKSQVSRVEMEYPTQSSINQRVLIGLALIAIAVFVTYGNTLRSEFIHDDKAEILQNPFIRDFSHIQRIFTSAAWAFGSEGPYQFGSNYYRPIQYLSYSVLYRSFGPDPRGYHLYKLLSHLAICGLFFWILWLWTQNYSLALFSALLFAVHPANTEAVSWISGITDTTCAFFFLLCFFVYLKDRSHPSNTKILLLSFLFFLGMLSKETMATFLGVIFVFEWIQTGSLPKLRQQLRVFVPLAAMFGIYVILRIHAIGAFTNPKQVQFRFDSLSLFQIFLNQITLLSQYVALFLYPTRLNAYHLFEPVTSTFSYRFGLAGLILTASLVSIFLLFNRLRPELRKPLLLGVLWFVIPLFPVLMFFKRLGENVFAERYVYLPSLGLCLSACLILTLLKGRYLGVAFALLVTVLAWTSIRRNRVWQNELVFYETTAKASPEAPGILNNLGAVYNRMARHQEAIKAFEASITAKPNLPALKNLAYVYATVGRLDDSEATYQKAIALDPMDAGAYAGLGDTLHGRGRLAEAIRNYEHSLMLYPASTVALFKYAEACTTSRHYDKALQALQMVVKLSPGESARAYEQLAKVYLAQNLPELAAEANRKASSAIQVQLFR